VMEHGLCCITAGQRFAVILAGALAFARMAGAMWSRDADAPLSVAIVDADASPLEVLSEPRKCSQNLLTFARPPASG
jgi:hypothetical protein